MQILENLEARVAQAVETIELLRMEKQEMEETIQRISQENERMQEDKQAWEAKLTNLVGQLSSADQAE